MASDPSAVSDVGKRTSSTSTAVMVAIARPSGEIHRMTSESMGMARRGQGSRVLQSPEEAAGGDPMIRGRVSSTSESGEHRGHQVRHLVQDCDGSSLLEL